MKIKRQITNNAKGFTLVEILVSITILSIIVVTFLTFFIQSAKTNASSVNMLDATYVAQSQMEEVYNLSTNVNYNQVKNELEGMGYTSTESGSEVIAAANIDEYTIRIRLDKPDEDDLGNIVIEVKDKTGKIKAKMETTIKWPKAEGV